MFKMNDCASRKKFKRKEKQLGYVYYSLILFMSFTFFSGVVFYVLRMNYSDFALPVEWREFFFILFTIYYCSLLSIILFSGLTLLYLLKYKYNFEYHNQKRTIMAFMVTEIFGYVIYIVVSNLIDTHTSWIKFERLYRYSGIRYQISTFGFLFIKKSKDPLEGI